MKNEFSAVLDISLVNQTPNLRSGASALALTSPHRKGQIPPGFGQISQIELDNCQIALISFQTTQGHVGLNSVRDGDLSQLLLLPLTWKELVSKISGEGRLTLENADNVARFGQVIANFSSMEANRSGRPVYLSALEFKVLKFFVSNPKRVVSRDELLDQVWGYNNYPSTRTVDNLVLKLRQKLEADFSNPVHFRTVHGAGYKFIP